MYVRERVARAWLMVRVMSLGRFIGEPHGDDGVEAGVVVVKGHGAVPCQVRRP